MKVSLLTPRPLELLQASRPGQNDQTNISSFGKVLKEKLQEVNELQKEADSLTQQLAAGQVEDLHQVMLAAEKANLALQLTVQVRNKLVEAYQEISRMQI